MPEDLQFKVSVDADTKGLEQTERALQDVTTAAKDAAKAGSLYTDEQKAQAQALADSLPPLKKAQQETENFGKTLGGVKAAIGGLGSVIGGLATGDLPQLVRGMLDLNKAAATAAGGLQTFLGSVARGAGIGAAIAAPLVLAIGIWKKEAAILDAQMQEIWAGQGKSTKKLAEQQVAEAERVAEAQERVAQAYRNTTSAIEAQTRVTQALNEEKKKQALLGATSPADRQRIEDAAAIESINVDIAAAQKRMDEANAAGDTEGFNRARDDLRILGARRVTATETQKKNVSDFAKAGATTRSGLAAQAAAQQASGDFAGQAATVAEIRKLDAELKKNGATIAGAVADVTKTVQKNTAKAKAVRESGGAGG